MSHNTDKETWINEVLGSTAGRQPVAPTGLYGKIMARLESHPVVRSIPFPVRRWAAAAVLLLALNIGSVAYFSARQNAQRSTTSNPFAAAIQDESTYNY